MLASEVPPQAAVVATESTVLIAVTHAASDADRTADVGSHCNLHWPVYIVIVASTLILGTLVTLMILAAFDKLSASVFVGVLFGSMFCGLIGLCLFGPPEPHKH